MMAGTIRVANKKDVWHLVQRGVLTQLHFDFEAFGLNTTFAQIQSYGDAVGDIAGNFIDTKEIDVRRPDRYIPTPQALTVVKTAPQELDDPARLPHRVAMAAIAQRFEGNVMTAIQSGVADDGRWIRTARRKGSDYYHKGHYESVVHFPLFDPDKKTEILPDGTIKSDPPGMLALNEKGEITIGPERKTVTVPQKVKLRSPDGKYQETTVYRPMRPEDGAISFDVRIHPTRNRLSYAFDEDPKSPYYENIDNNFYQDADSRDAARSNAPIGSRKWRFTEPRLAISGYRIKWYDIPVLRPNLVRAGFHPSNIFFTHSKSTISKKQLPKNFAIDGYSAVMNAGLQGPQGEEGLKFGGRTDSRTGEKAFSAKLELVMAANSRYENKARGVRAGVLMPDGSLYDARKGHKSPAYDAAASFAIYNYARELAPDVIKRQELQADDDYLRDLLPGNDLLESHPPIFAMMRSNYPGKPEIDPIAFVGFDDQQGQLRRAITVRLDIGDLRNYTFNGKTLLQMAREDAAQKDPAKWNFVKMMREQGRGSNALLRVDSLRKFHGVARIGEVMHTEAARNWDIEQLDDNFRFLADKGNSEILDAVRNAVEIINWEMRQKPLPANPRVEEQAPFNSFGDIDFLELEAREEKIKRKFFPERGQPLSVSQTLYEKAMDVFKYHNAVDELIHRLAIQAHPVDLHGFDTSMDKREAIRNYWELFHKVYGRLEEKDCPYVHIFDEFKDSNGRLVPPGKISAHIEVGTYANGKPKIKHKVLSLHEMNDAQLDQSLEQILAFRWGLMKRILDDDQLERGDARSEYGNGLFDHKYSKKGRVLLANLSRDFRVVDERGRELGFDYLRRQFQYRPNDLLKRLESKEWRIQFFRQTSEPSTSVILMQFADMGKLGELDPLWQYRYKAMRALYLNGAPNEDPVNMRWDGIPALERALLAMETNSAIDDKSGLARVFSDFVSGEAEVFLRSDEGRRFLADYRTYLHKIKTENPFTDNFKMTMGYDPETNLPYDWIEDEIDRDDFVMIDVPDAHLRRPLEDSRHTPYSLVIGEVSEHDRNRIVHKQIPVVLRGMQTGRLYFPGPVNLGKAVTENASYSDYYEQARRAYEDESGLKLPPPEQRHILRIGGLVPIGNVRTLDYAIQTFKVPNQHFDGLVAPRLAYLDDDKPLTGLALPVDYCPQHIAPGEAMRFRETRSPMGSKMDGVEGKETGHAYETTLRTARRITLGNLRQEVQSGKFTDLSAQRFGYAGAHDMWEKINAAFLNRESPARESEEIYLIEFDPVDKATWVYDPPFRALGAAFTRNGAPVPPVRLYRPANDGGAAPAPAQNAAEKLDTPASDAVRGIVPGAKTPQGPQ